MINRIIELDWVYLEQESSMNFIHEPRDQQSSNLSSRCNLYQAQSKNSRKTNVIHIY